MNDATPLLAFWILLGFSSAVPCFAAQAAKPRLLVLTDIGGDPDDQQSMIRLMLYSNEFDMEGLIATASGTPGELKKKITRPDLIRQIVEAYGEVRPNLLKHKPGYPTAKYLLQRIKSGNPHRGLEAIGKGHDTEGSNWIIAVVDEPDPRPVNICIWGGQTDLAQALWRVRNGRDKVALKRFVAKLRVYDISDQDRIQPWIFKNFPDLFYVLSRAPKGRDKREGAYRGMYLGGEQSLTSREWVNKHVRTGHGPLGALYPRRTWTAPNPHGCLKEGDTPSWFYFLPNGLNAPEHPEWGGWGGRYVRTKGNLFRDAKDTVAGETHARATVYRWRPAYQADFQARMDWCVKSFEEANHNPIVRIAEHPAEVKVGQTIRLDASASTAPGGHNLSFRWWAYKEAGTFRGKVEIKEANSAVAEIAVLKVQRAGTAHVVLDVIGDGHPRLTGYGRVVVHVSAK